MNTPSSTPEKQTITLAESSGKLPSGIKYKDGIHFDFVLRKPDRHFWKTYKNARLAQKNMSKWLASSICHIIESIGPFPVYAEWAASKFKTIPDIIKGISDPDCIFVLCDAHLASFSRKQKVERDGVPTNCSRPENCLCQKESILDIGDLEVSFHDEDGDKFERIRHAYLEDGLVIGDGENAKRFNRIGLRRQTLGDALRYAGQHEYDSSLAVARDCIVSIEEVTDTDEVVNRLEKADWDFLDSDLMGMFSPQDIAIIHDASSRIPGLKLGKKEKCNECDEEFSVPLDIAKLLPTRVGSKKKNRKSF